MVLTAQQITQTLRKCVVRIGYGTRDEKKTVRCTLSPQYLPDQIDLEEMTNSDLIVSAWDVVHKKWIMIDPDRITNFEPEV